MKFLLFVVAAFAAISTVCSYVPTEDSEELMQQIGMKVLRDKLRQHAAIEQMKNSVETICPGYGSRIENITAQIETCAALVDEDEETFCSMVQNHVPRCTQPITDMLDECLPAQAKKVPVMILDMLTAATKHMCKINGEHLFELGNPCFRNFNTKTERCVRRLKAKFQDYSRRGQLPSAQQLCDIAESLRPCLLTHLNSACGHPITREAYLDMYDDIMVVCKSYEMNEIEVIQ